MDLNVMQSARRAAFEQYNEFSVLLHGLHTLQLRRQVLL